MDKNLEQERFFVGKGHTNFVNYLLVFNTVDKFLSQDWEDKTGRNVLDLMSKLHELIPNLPSREIYNVIQRVVNSKKQPLNHSSVMQDEMDLSTSTSNDSP